ncbi:hypothetical protein ACWGS9_22745, partial [Bradyrhizobium sp. Arg314]
TFSYSIADPCGRSFQFTRYFIISSSLSGDREIPESHCSSPRRTSDRPSSPTIHESGESVRRLRTYEELIPARRWIRLKRVEQFTQALADHEDGRRAAEALRSLIGEIVLTPSDRRGAVHAELRGELFGILEFANPEQNQRIDRIMTKGVAGPRNHHICNACYRGCQTILSEPDVEVCLGAVVGAVAAELADIG